MFHKLWISKSFYAREHVNICIRMGMPTFVSACARPDFPKEFWILRHLEIVPKSFKIFEK
jgi:hypothetical protein